MEETNERANERTSDLQEYRQQASGFLFFVVVVVGTISLLVFGISKTDTTASSKSSLDPIRIRWNVPTA